MENMTCKINVISYTPIIKRLCKSFQEKVVCQVNVIKSCSGKTLTVDMVENLRQNRTKIIAVALLKFLENVIGISSFTLSYTICIRQIIK